MTTSYNLSEFDDWLPPEPAPPNGGHGRKIPFTAPDRICDGSRNDTLYRLARSLHAKGLSPDAIRAALAAENLTKCDPPLPADELEALVSHATTQFDRSDFAVVPPVLAPTMPARLDPDGLDDAPVVVAQGKAIAANGVPYLVAGIVPHYGMLGLLVAYAKVGKTTLAQAFAAAVAVGAPFLGRATHQVRVLIIAAEDPAEYTAFLARHLDTLPTGVLTFYRRPILLDAAGLAAIVGEVAAGGYGFVLIASWQAVVRGLIRDENDNAGAVRVMEDVKAAARRTGVPWLIDAHSGKGEDQGDEADPSKAMRGASGAAGAADYTLSLRYANGPFGSGRRLSGKGRFVSFAPLVLDYDLERGTYTVTGTSKEATAETTWRLISEMGALTSTPQTAATIAQASGLVATKGRVTATGRRQVHAALARRPGVRVTTETRRGQLTTLYSLQEDVA